MSDTRYPEITVKLSGKDGNAFSIIGRVRRALRNSGVPDMEIAEFTDEATGGDYGNVLMACMRWVNCR